MRFINQSCTQRQFLSIIAFVLAFLLLGCGAEQSPEEKVAKAQEQAIKGYVRGLFTGDLQRYLDFSASGQTLSALGAPNLANLSVAAESTRAQMAGGYEGVEILEIVPLQDKKERAKAKVRIRFGNGEMKTELELAGDGANRWVVMGNLSLIDAPFAQNPLLLLQ